VVDVDFAEDEGVAERAAANYFSGGWAGNAGRCGWVLWFEVNGMAQGIDSTKTGSRPSHEAIESNDPATEVGRTKQEKMDDVAMESAKRAGNRIKSNVDSSPGDGIFTK
jgi:hypothetical protein